MNFVCQDLTPNTQYIVLFYFVAKSIRNELIIIHESPPTDLFIIIIIDLNIIKKFSQLKAVSTLHIPYYSLQEYVCMYRIWCSNPWIP